MKKKFRSGFTLIELMIVVAIIGILAAISVAAYGAYITDARLGEGKTLVSDVRAKQEAYFSSWGSYLTAAANPATIPSSSTEPWVTLDTWTELGVAPGKAEIWWQLEAFSGTGGDAGGVEGPDITAADRPWFKVGARMNMDNNAGTNPTTIFITSENATPIVYNKGQ